MKNYLELVRKIIEEGEDHDDRTGVGTKSLFGEMLHWDLRKGFPLLTTKKVFFKSVVQELLWFLRGETNTKTLGNHIWDGWADENGDVGPVYGHQWIHWPVFEPYVTPLGLKTMQWSKTGEINQIQAAINQIKGNPNSRRIIVTAWNPSDVPKQGLPCCHILFQFKVVEKMVSTYAKEPLYRTEKYLDMIWYQRSCDFGLGVPFNIASYALLLKLIANECGLIPRNLKGVFADAHVYKNHIDGLKEQLQRTPYDLPQIALPEEKSVFDITEEEILLLGYMHHPPIKLKVAV